MKKLGERYLLLFICFLFSCSHYTAEIDAVLKQAGKNRKELEKVLKHYRKNPSDSLKLRAAEFLIVNMPGKYSEYYDAPWNDVATVYLRWTSSSNKQLVLDEYDLDKPVKMDDIEHITANYLINNIELAFKVWNEMPWGRDIPFDVFCEEILPYRVSTEPLENWRKKVLASFADFYKSFRDDTTSITPVEACRLVNDKLPRFKIDKDYPPISYSQLMATARGPCENLVSLAIFVMRGLGIPVTFDFSCLQYGFQTGHSWNCVYNGNCTYHPFMGTEVNPGLPIIGPTIYKAKIYRRMYANQHNVNLVEADIPQLLHRVNHMVDVTAQYDFCRNISIPVTKRPFDQMEYPFLSIFHNKQWQPIGWGIADEDSMRFESVQSGLYMPVYYYRNGIQIPASFPFYLNSDGDILMLKPDTIQTLSLTGIDQVNTFGGFGMTDAIFEIANRSDFSDARKIHTIHGLPEPFYHTVTLKQPVTGRYVRCVPSASVGGRCFFTTIEFYDEKGEIQRGTVIGTRPNEDEAKLDAVFNGNGESFFQVVSNYTWIGLDLGKPSKITSIRYLPLTDWNAIYVGHVYELFYWDGTKWNSLGQKKADSHILTFNAPANALFMLENVTRNRVGSKPFFMEDGKQIWIRYD